MLSNRLFAGGVRWHSPGRSPFGGEHTGIGEVMTWLGRSFEASGGTIRIESHHVIGNDGHVVAPTTVRAEREDRGATPITRSGAATTATMPTEVADHIGRRNQSPLGRHGM